LNDEHQDPPGGNGRAVDALDSASEKGLEPVDEQPSPADALEALQRENADLRDQLLRRRADFENYRRRVERERATAGQEAQAALLKDLVPSLDNLERALQAGGDAAALKDGVLLIQRGLVATLEAHGLRSEDPQGARFDPEGHQALSYDEAPDAVDGTVLRVFAKGYFHRDRLLRPAMVQVARGTPAPAAEAPSPADASSSGEAAPETLPGPDDAPGKETLH
jgi:molecular chaperone GrpE